MPTPKRPAAAEMTPFRKSGIESSHNRFNLPTDDASAIIREATTGTDPVCRRALQTFLSIYGSAAGNLALTFRATGGVYLAGSLVPSLRDPLADGTFRAAFCRKAPMHDLLARIPVHAILDERAALLGAATVAARDLRTQRGSGWAS